MEEMTHGFVNIDDYEGKKKIQTDKDFKSLQFQRKKNKTKKMRIKWLAAWRNVF